MVFPCVDAISSTYSAEHDQEEIQQVYFNQSTVKSIKRRIKLIASAQLYMWFQLLADVGLTPWMQFGKCQNTM